MGLLLACWDILGGRGA